MSSEQGFCRFADLFETPQRNGLTRPKRVRGSGLPMVNMGELFAHKRIHDIPMDLVPYKDSECASLLKHADLLFARQSLVLEGAGQCSIFLGHKKTVFESHLIRCRIDRNKGDPLFYYYFFSSQLGKDLIRQIVSQGAGASGIKGSELVELLVPQPPKTIQKKISHLMNAVDCEIETLERQNTALESIAQTLFRSWFVDFDPVHTKLAGKEPEAMSPELASLFPSEFEDSEMGLIPKGWSVTPFSQTVTIHSGGTPKTSMPEYWGGDIPWFSVTDAPSDGQVFVLSTDKKITKEGLANSPTKLLPRRSTIISARGTVGKIGMVEGLMTMNQSCYALASKQVAGEYWAYFETRRLVTQLKQMAHGGVFDTITKSTFDGVTVVAPSDAVQLHFARACQPIFDTIANNGRLVATLAQLRDHLLPRLISGKLRIEDAEASVAAITSELEAEPA